MGLLKLADKYSADRLEAACAKALAYTSSPSFKSIKNILAAEKDRPVPAEGQEEKAVHNEYALTRGADYYGRQKK